jgi:hypothetical protein
MATEQIQTNQIAGYSSGARVETKLITLSGGAADKTTSAFSFVVGPVLIEVTAGSDDATDVYATLWANMRSYSGTKTNNVTNRTARGVTGGATCHCAVDRTTSGTVLVISQIDQGADFEADGTVIASLNLKNWPASGRLRITAWEDTQS